MNYSQKKRKFFDNKKFWDMTIADAAIRLGVSETTVRSYRRELGLVNVHAEYARAQKAKASLRSDLDKIIRNGECIHPTVDIARSYGLSSQTVNRYFKEFGVKPLQDFKTKPFNDNRPYMEKAAAQICRLMNGWARV